MYKICGKKISSPFTIPSGIITTEASAIELIANEVPEIGIITTKSIGAEPREGNREPVLAQYENFSFINAVGLRNPGVKEFKKHISKINFPENKFLLTSIFGKNLEEFIYVAEELKDFTDGFEINVSCPHAKGYGQSIGEDFELVSKIVKNISSLGKPVFVKLSPNIKGLKELVKICEKSKASGITAINTLGPGLLLHEGNPILTNVVGGISGKAILPIGLKCVKEIREVTNLPIIACGGISSAEDVRNYQKAGANFFGIGSALAGMKTEEIKNYFKTLLEDLKKGSNNAVKYLKSVDMSYKKYKVKKKVMLTETHFLLELEGEINISPGQFVFLWLPKKGEKPFSVLNDKPITFFIQKRGTLTEILSKLEPGDYIYLRGPYGNPLELKGKALLVGGGTGIAALYLFAKKGNCVAVLGAKSKNYLPYIEEFKKVCDVYITTEDGSLGKKGVITDILPEILENERFDYCINCGPKAMVEKVIELELKYLPPERIFSSLEYITMCGIGLCGSCATEKGYRSCVDGTFLTPKFL